VQELSAPLRQAAQIRRSRLLFTTGGVGYVEIESALLDLGTRNTLESLGAQGATRAV